MSSSVSRREVWDPRQQILRFRKADGPEDGEDDQCLSLRAAYEKFELPDQKYNSPANRVKFDTVLKKWERFWEARIERKSAEREPALGDIDDETSLLAKSVTNALAASPSRVPINQLGTSFVSASIAVHVQTSP